jgi:hypothetical protein
VKHGLSRKGTSIEVFENKVLRRILGLKREEVAGGWRSRYSEKFCNPVHFTKYYLGNYVKEGEIGALCSTHGRDEKGIQNFCPKT